VKGPGLNSRFWQAFLCLLFVLLLIDFFAILSQMLIHLKYFTYSRLIDEHDPLTRSILRSHIQNTYIKHRAVWYLRVHHSLADPPPLNGRGPMILNDPNAKIPQIFLRLGVYNNV